MNEIRKQSGRRFKEVRLALGMSRQEFADALYISPSHLANIETGNRNVCFALLYELNKKFNVSSDYITSGIGCMFSVKDSCRLSIYNLSREQRLLLFIELMEYILLN